MLSVFLTKLWVNSTTPFFVCNITQNDVAALKLPHKNKSDNSFHLKSRSRSQERAKNRIKENNGTGTRFAEKCEGKKEIRYLKYCAADLAQGRD